ncbi:MAG TPA: DUF1289 domain-containing protein [Caulobacteraceae bacterium]
MPVTDPKPPIASPCVRLCVVDGASGLCVGCLRTLGEIAGWAGFSDAERAEIMRRLPERRDRVPRRPGR